MNFDPRLGSFDFYARNIKITELTIAEFKELIHQCLKEHANGRAGIGRDKDLPPE